MKKMLITGVPPANSAIVACNEMSDKFERDWTQTQEAVVGPNRVTIRPAKW